MIDHFEPLVTNRLTLEPITAEAARAIVEGDVGALDPAEGWPQAGTTNGISFALERGHPPGWLIRSGGRVIGDCGIHGPADEAGCVEIGYGLADGAQGHGFGSEAVEAISDWLLERPGISTVRARTVPSNAPSRRVLEKAGFIMVGETGGYALYQRQR